MQLVKRYSHRYDTYPKDAYYNKEHYFEEMPISVIRDLEKYEFPGPERIHRLEHH